MVCFSIAIILFAFKVVCISCNCKAFEIIHCQSITNTFSALSSKVLTESDQFQQYIFTYTHIWRLYIYSNTLICKTVFNNTLSLLSSLLFIYLFYVFLLCICQNYDPICENKHMFDLHHRRLHVMPLPARSDGRVTAMPVRAMRFQSGGGCHGNTVPVIKASVLGWIFSGSVWRPLPLRHKASTCQSANGCRHVVTFFPHRAHLPLWYATATLSVIAS